MSRYGFQFIVQTYTLAIAVCSLLVSIWNMAENITVCKGAGKPIVNAAVWLMVDALFVLFILPIKLHTSYFPSLLRHVRERREREIRDIEGGSRVDHKEEEEEGLCDISTSSLTSLQECKSAEGVGMQTLEMNVTKVHTPPEISTSQKLWDVPFHHHHHHRTVGCGSPVSRSTTSHTRARTGQNNSYLSSFLSLFNIFNKRNIFIWLDATADVMTVVRLAWTIIGTIIIAKASCQVMSPMSFQAFFIQSLLTGYLVFMNNNNQVNTAALSMHNVNT